MNISTLQEHMWAVCMYSAVAWLSPQCMNIGLRG